MSLEDDDDQDKIGGEAFADLEPLEDLDDAEFGLPPVDNPPTLEEILNEDDDLPRTVDDFDDDANSSFAGFSDIGGPLSSLSAALHHLGLEGNSHSLEMKSIKSNSTNKCHILSSEASFNATLDRSVVLCLF